MASRRRPRGSLVDVQQVALGFEAAANARLTALAAAAGTTKSALAQWLVERVPVDERGVPLGWEEDHPCEELPIGA